MAMSLEQSIDNALLAQICADCHIKAEDIEEVYDCTPFQAGLLTDGADYAHSLVHSLDDWLDLDRLRASLYDMISLIETVRTRIVDSPTGLLQVVVKGAASEDCVSQHFYKDVEHYLKEVQLTPMHLGTPLARFAFVGRKLVTTVHHAIADSYTHRFFFEDLCKIYQRKSPARRAPFREFVNYCKKIDTTSAAIFWRAQFNQRTPAIFPSIPLGHPVKASHPIVRRITLAKSPSLPLMPAYIEAAWALTASDYTGSDSVVFGYALSGRSAPLGGAETTPGPTVSMVPMQVDLRAGTTIKEILQSRNEFRRSLLSSSFLHYGLASIRNDASKDARFTIGFQTVLDIFPHDEEEVDTPGLTIERIEQTYGYALCLLCQFSKGGILINAIFDPVVLPPAQVQRVLRQMEYRLKALIESPSSTQIEQLSILNFGDTLELLKWNRKIPETAGLCLHDLFTLQCDQNPDHAAVDAWDGMATYRELDQLSNSMAQELLLRNIAVEEPIPFVLERSLSAVVAILGIMKAGGTCVPVDVSLPQARKDAILRIVGARLVITSSSNEAIAGCETLPIMRSHLPEDAAGLHEPPRSNPRRAAYILFTSGSTGQPKGVVLEHRSMATSYMAICNRVGWTSGTRVLQYSSLAWDACAFEILGPLIVGGCVCIPSAEARESALGEYINCLKVDSALQTPTALRNLTPEDTLPALKTLILGGEPIPKTASTTWGSKVRLFNAWGPCETSAIATVAELYPASVHPTTIGTPVGSSTVWIVNSKDTSKLVPIGAVGEMLVEGPGVARGYYNNSNQTTSSFIPAPPFIPKSHNTSHTLYRTDDLAKYNADGSIEFVGRRDNQVKIRGQRFELEEIEEVIRSHHYEGDVVMTALKSPSQGREDLIASVTLQNGGGDHSSSDTQEDKETRQVKLNEANFQQLQILHDSVRASLPPYMVPTAWVIVNHLPKFASTKIDRVRLRLWLQEFDLTVARDLARRFEGEICSANLTQPETPAERVLQQIWASVLVVEEASIGRESSFVRLGGDSITAMQVATRCQKQGFPITVAVLLRARTLTAAASAIEALDSACATPLEQPLDNLQLSDTDRDSISRMTASLPTTRSEDQPRSPSINAVDPAIMNSLAELSGGAWPWLKADNIESVAPATDTQSSILGCSERLGRASYNGVTLSPLVGQKLNELKLQQACRAVIVQHAILRTVFIRHKGQVFQVALHDPPIEQVLTHQALPMPDHPSILKTLPKFYLTSDGSSSCQKLELRIHHVLYDAISMGCLFNDLGAAYSGRVLATRSTHFHEWISQVNTEGTTEAYRYWRNLLQGVSPSSLVRVLDSSTSENPVDSKISFKSNIQGTPASDCTEATIFKAACSVALSQVLDEQDIVFSYINANRSSTVPDVDKVVGPCINLLPVRARINEQSTIASFVAELQKQSTESAPYQHVGLLSVVQDCTQWPKSKFGTVITFQNHRSVGDTVNLGDVGCSLSMDGRAGDSADIIIDATPQPDGQLKIGLQFSSVIVPVEKAIRMAACLDATLGAFPTYWTKTIASIKQHINAAATDKFSIGKSS
ncbi:unnamed protein product [Penicillium salamii]|nr:unnamed protein product [Penicillium salamii]CAG8268406.1 unnamed protein product [Penicillium salamii]